MLQQSCLPHSRNAETHVNLTVTRGQLEVNRKHPIEFNNETNKSFHNRKYGYKRRPLMLLTLTTTSPPLDIYSPSTVPTQVLLWLFRVFFPAKERWQKSHTKGFLCKCAEFTCPKQSRVLENVRPQYSHAKFLLLLFPKGA